MLDLIFNKLSPEMLLMGSIVGAAVVLLGMLRPAICLALGFPSLLFLGKLSEYYSISVSAAAALFPLAVSIGVLLKRFRLPSLGRTEILMILLAILMSVSVIYSPYPAYGQEKAVLFFFMVVPLVVVIPAVITNIRDLQTIISIIIFSLALYTVVSVVLPGRSESIDGGGRVAALGDVIRAGQFLGLFLLVGLLYLSCLQGNLLSKVVVGILFLVGLFLLLRTGTRGAFSSFLISSAFLYWFFNSDWYQKLFNITRKSTFKLHISIFLFLGLVAFSLSYVDLETSTRFQNFFDNFTGSEIDNWDTTSSTRAGYFGSAVYGFLDAPIQGLGSGGFRAALEKYNRYFFISSQYLVLNSSSHVYPHNLLLEITVEMGLMGLLLILLILYFNWKSIKLLRRIVHVNPKLRWLIGSCVGIYVYGFLVSMSSLDIPRMMIFWWGLALLLAAEKIFLRNLRFSKTDLITFNDSKFPHLIRYHKYND